MNFASSAGRMAAPVEVVARFAALPALLAPLRVDADRRDGGIDAQLWLRAQIAVEELFVNSIRHGYGQECDRPVWLSVTCADGILSLVYADAAAPFDPFATLKPLSERRAAGLETLHPGGLGRLLVKELSDRCEYCRDAGRNVLRLEFSHAGHRGGKH